jgi:hypothetical protein
MRKQWKYIRGRFTMTLMKLRLQGPSLALAPFKALGGALVMWVTWSHVFEKFAKIRNVKHNSLSIIAIHQAVINKQL